jgi:NAD(P)-dependent dehydrogenase (short-subunit alcohol dehydrogenase family)
MANPTELGAYIVTGPTSGIGCATALELANHGTVVLVGPRPQETRRSPKGHRENGQCAVPVVCDLSDILSVRRAAEEIVALRFPIVGLLNNAGMLQTRATKTAQGWDTTFASNHLGPFVLTEALIPHLPDRPNIVFIASGGRPRTQARRGCRFPRRSLYLCRGECMRRMETGRLHNAGGGRLRDVQAMHPRHNDGACPRKSTATHQRG